MFQIHDQQTVRDNNTKDAWQALLTKVRRRNVTGTL